MKSIRQAVADYLLDDDVLLSMLEQNQAWWDETKVGTQYSIVPVNKGPLPGTPYLTIQYLTDNQDGYELKSAIFVIRCYNAKDKTYVEIDTVLDRVKALLHRHRFTNLDGNVSVQTEYEFTGGELEDQTYEQNFRESQFRVLYL